MTSLNSYWDAIKPLAKTIKKKAIEFTDAVDEKFEKTQKNLERQLIKVSEPEPSPHLWRSSNAHPSGEIIIIPKAVPITPPVTPIIPPKSRTLVLAPEPETVRRRRSQHPPKRYDSENRAERKQKINECLNDIINEIIEKEDIEKCLNQIIDVIITMDDLIDKTSINTISTDDSLPIEFTTTESDVSDSSSSFDTSLEISYRYEQRKSFEEHIGNTTGEFPIQQIDTTETLDSPVIIPKENSFDNSSPITSNIIDLPPVEVPQKKEKRFPLVNRYSLPPDIIVSYMSCSSTYIYICTNQKSLFYAKVPENNLNNSLNWYCYNLPAERLIVSNTNQTIWRIFNKSIYLSSDTIKLSPLGIHWTKLKFNEGENLLSTSINDQYGWYIKEDGTLWLIKINDEEQRSLNIPCPFYLNRVVCSLDKIGVATKDGQILVRIECTNDCPEGGGWIFIQHNFGLYDDFALITNSGMICIIDKKHRIFIHDWSLNEKFYEVLRNDEYVLKSTNRYLIDINDKFLCFTDCDGHLYIFSSCLTGIHWSLVQKNTRLQHLIAAFSNENYVWALTTNGTLCSSNGQILEKPRQAQYLTHASCVPQMNSERILWSLDESCNIYIRNNLNENSKWEQLDQTQFDWNRRLIHIVCNTAGVWAVDDHGCIHFRHGHISNSNEFSFLNPAWITIPGEPKTHRSFLQIFCGPEEWMIYATDNRQALYARIGVDETNPVGTSWKVIEDCSVLELAISEHTLWLLTSHGRIQCRENISLNNPIGTRLTTLPGRFNSITVSNDDDQVWTLYTQHHLYKLDRLTVLFEK